MIHSTMSLLPFFSSAIKRSTPHLNFRFKYRSDFPGAAFVYGFPATAFTRL